MNIETLFKISYGLYIVSSRKGDKLNGHIVNTVFQATAEPPTIAICTNKKNFTKECIDESGIFSISIIEQDVDMKFIGPFGFKSGRDIDKFENLEYKIGKTGAPIVLSKSIGYIECEVINKMDVGTHVIYIANIIDAQMTADKEPLTYCYYRDVIRGFSPENAPTYVKKEKKKTSEPENPKYKCKVCGWVYDPAKGDPDSGIKPGTAFKDIPDDWVCPVCGVGKDDFEEI